MNILYKFKTLFFIMAFSIIVNVTYAQYFVSEVDPCNLKWLKLKSDKKGNIVFPDYVLDKAVEISFYRDALSNVVDYNIPTKLRRFQISLHPTNMRSNGMVTYAPQRMELYTMPSRYNFSLPWLKHLLAHEYRHVAQLSNLDQGFTKVFSYIIGEQMLGLTAATMPVYFYEGDAVVAETQFSMWGRGRQPSFTAPLRAELMENEKINFTSYYVGSLNNFTPDPYLMGYFATQYMTQHFGDDFWSKILTYAARNPYFIDPSFFSYRKYSTKKSETDIIRSTMKQMKEFWHETSSVPNSANIITPNQKSYANYISPLPLSDSIIIVHKSDLDRAGRFITVNVNSGEEKFLRNTGSLSSNPVMVGNSVYWCEIVQSLSWGQKNSSIIFKMEISEDSGEYSATRPKQLKRISDNYFFITPYKNSGFAAVSYNRENNASIILMDKNFSQLSSFPLNADVSFNGLSYDNITKKIYAAIVDNRGTSLMVLDAKSDKLENLMPPNYGTITNLNASNGKLYYTSIHSGKEEVHIYDLLQEKEFQLTTSKYGSNASVPFSMWSSNKSNSNKILMTTYTIDGYLVSSQNISDSTKLKECKWSKFPESVLDYPFKQWDVPKLDTINITESEIIKNIESDKVSKYRKGANAINIHSWIPIYLDLDELMDERKLSVGVGINLLSQNLLNNVVVIAGYGRVNNENIFNADISYNGLPVEIGVDIEYGGGKQLTNNFISDSQSLDNFFQVDASLSLPFNLSSGANNRFFSAKLSYIYLNSLTKNLSSPSYNLDGSNLNQSFSPSFSEIETIKGMSKSGATIIFQNTLKSTQKDLRSRLGYFVQLNTTFNPIRSDYGTIYSVFARGYLPAPLPHGSLVVEAAYQYQEAGDYNYNQIVLFPRGAYITGPIENCYSFSADYRVPLFYPNGGLGTFLNFQRVSCSIFADYSVYNYVSSKSLVNKNSYGGSVIFDINIFGFRNLFNIEISTYKPSDSNDFFVGTSFNVNF